MIPGGPQRFHQNGGWLGGAMQWLPSRASSGLAMSPLGGTLISDRRSKERIRDLERVNARLADLAGDPDVAHELEGTTQNEYEYKDKKAPGAGEGRFAGPMSDELRGIPGVVKEGPDGFDRVDGGRLALATAPVVGEHERELRRIRARMAELD